MNGEPLIAQEPVCGSMFVDLQNHRRRNSAWIGPMAEEHDAIAAMETKADAGSAPLLCAEPLVQQACEGRTARNSKFLHNSRDSGRLVECVRHTRRERALN